MEMVTLVRTDSQNLDLRNLVALLDGELALRDGDQHFFYAPFNTIDAIKEVVVAYRGKVAVGCGAIKPFSKTAVEVKRMFVQPSARSQGIACNIITELESWAFNLGFSECMLETGRNQPEAIALYKKIRYKITENYGQYIGVENSICMSKFLKN